MLMIMTICGMDNEVAAVVLPIATSILIFLGGGLAKVFSDNIKRRKDIKSGRCVVFRWSGMTINSAKKQISLEKTVQTDPLRIVQIDPRFFLKFLPAA